MEAAHKLEGIDLNKVTFKTVPDKSNFDKGNHYGDIDLLKHYYYGGVQNK